MAITREGDHRSLLAVCIEAAPIFHLSPADARQIIEEMDDAVRANWDDAADAARLTKNQRDSLWESSILNPAIYWER